MNEIFTKSIQFWVKTDGIMRFSALIEKSDLLNCIIGIDSGAVVVEVDYNPEDEKEAYHISTLQQWDIILHHEFVD